MPRDPRPLAVALASSTFAVAAAVGCATSIVEPATVPDEPAEAGRATTTQPALPSGSTEDGSAEGSRAQPDAAKRAPDAAVDAGIDTGTSATTGAQKPGQGEVLISEVMYDPSTG